MSTIYAKHRKPRTPLVIPESVAKRAATKYKPNKNGCWISDYSVASHGYAQVGWWVKELNKSRMTTAHRAAWVHANKKQVPDNMTVDHTCGVRTCVNPEHLRILSNFENARRTNGRDWPLGQCANGHANKHLRQRASGRHECQICRRQWRRKYETKLLTGERMISDGR